MWLLTSYLRTLCECLKKISVQNVIYVVFNKLVRNFINNLIFALNKSEQLIEKIDYIYLMNLAIFVNGIEWISLRYKCISVLKSITILNL